MRMLNRWKLSGLQEFLEFLAKRGYSVQVPRKELDKAIAEWLESYNPSYIRQFRAALILAGLLEAHGSGRIFNIRRRNREEVMRDAPTAR